jgi:hypothetical protein
MLKKHLFHVILTAVAAFALCLTSQGRGAETDNATLLAENVDVAVVDVGERAAPLSFVEVFWVRLGETPGVQLVEREQIEKVLKEQALALSFDDESERVQAVKAGKLMSADILVMLEAGKPTQGQIPIRFRLVETRYGLKFWDTAFWLDQTERSHPEHAEELAKRIAPRLSAMSEDSNCVFIGVGTFRSEELSPRWNWVSDELTAGLEQQLAMLPSIILLERHRVRPLADERALVAGLPESLRTSTVFIDGSFRLDRQKVGGHISVTVRGNSAGKKVFVLTVAGTLKDLASLVERVAATVTEALHTKSAQTRMDRSSESAMLLAEAKSFIAFDDRRRAVALLEAAAAVDPNALEARVQLIRLGKWLSGSYWGADIEGPKRELYKREIIPLLLNNVAMARQIINHCDAVLSGHKRMDRRKSAYDGAMHEARDVFRYPPVIVYNLGKHNDTLEALETLCPALADLHPPFVEAVKGRCNLLYAQVVKDGIAHGFWWASSPQQYLEDLQRWLEISAGRDPSNWRSNFSAGCSFEFAKCPLWENRGDNAERYLAFLHRLELHDSPLLRACAQQGFIRFYGDREPAKVAEHYRTLVKIMVNDLIPELPKWGHELGMWNPNLRYVVAKVVSPQELAQSHARVIHKVLQHAPRFHMGTWRDRILTCYESLEQCRQYQEAANLLTACIERLEDEPHPHRNGTATIKSWLRNLKEQHPEVSADVDLLPVRRCKPLMLLHAKDVSNLFQQHGMSSTSTPFRRLAIDEESIAIVCVWDTADGAQCGILKLHPDTLAFTSFEFFDDHIPFSLGRLAGLRSFYYSFGPVVAAADGTFYVAFPNGGVVVFPAAGTPRLLHEGNGLPSNMIIAMDAMNGRLYSVTGFRHDTGLIEVDPNSNEARILISPRKRGDAHPLDGSEIASVAADRFSNRLWLGLDREPKRGGYHTICKYDIVSGQTDPISEEIIAPSLLAWFRRERQFLHISTDHQLHVADLAREQIRLVAKHDTQARPQAPGPPWQTNLHLFRFAAKSDTLLSTARDPGGRRHVVQFRADQAEPFKLRGPVFQSVHDIKDLAATDEGLLVLTPKALYLVSNEEGKE